MGDDGRYPIGVKADGRLTRARPDFVLCDSYGQGSFQLWRPRGQPMEMAISL